jgi:hypothetical protein
VNIETKIKRLGKSLKQAQKSGNFRRIHKWENDIDHANKRMCPWNPLIKRESLFRIKNQLANVNVTDYTWDWCGLCRCAFVRCPKCGNNCCNAGYGWLRPNGSRPQQGDDYYDLVPCTVCKTAYDIQEFAYRTGTEPPRSNFDADRIEADCDNRINESFDWLDEEENAEPTSSA